MSEIYHPNAVCHSWKLITPEDADEHECELVRLLCGEKPAFLSNDQYRENLRSCAHSIRILVAHKADEALARADGMALELDDAKRKLDAAWAELYSAGCAPPSIDHAEGIRLLKRERDEARALVEEFRADVADRDFQLVETHRQEIAKLTQRAEGAEQSIKNIQENFVNETLRTSQLAQRIAALEKANAG